MARTLHADDVLVWDYDNNTFKVVIDDTNCFKVDLATVELPGHAVVSGNLTVIGTITPISGTFANFHVTSNLMVSGTVTNPVGNLILSASNSFVHVSGGLTTLGNTTASGTLRVVGGVTATSGVFSSYMLSSGPSTFSGTIVGTSDISVPGGIPQSYLFYRNRILQGDVCKMTSSIIYVSASWQDPITYTDIPMVRSGSVLGLAVFCVDSIIKSGSLTCSVALGSTTSSLATVILTTGTLGGFTLAKDSFAFNGFTTLGVIMSASSGFNTELTVTSASFIANVLVEL